MSYTALYRKFRPLQFSEMVGQEHITRTLKNQIMADRVGHAYLFNGGRGTGKTSAAKILSRAINCLNPIDGEPCNECEICKGALSGALTDIVEMDAASNNGVDDIRSIREEVAFLPTKAKYRVYIIDEVHMLSSGAFNALLKTLEEPPEHVKFILATTEPQKLPATILSRCQRFDFKKISNDNIIKRLKIVCDESNIEISEEALKIIAVLSEGAMRDALSILERCIQDGSNKISEEKIKDLVGIPKTEYIYKIVNSFAEYNVEEALKVVEEVINEGKDIENFVWEIIKYLKDILIYKTSGKAELYNKAEIEDMKALSDKISKEKLLAIIYKLSEIENSIKFSNQKLIMLQAGVINLCNKEEEDKKEILSRIDKIENYLKNNKGTIAAQPVMSKTRYNQQPPTNSQSIQSKQQKNTIAKTSTIQKKNYSNKIEEYWPQIVKDLKDNGKIVLYTNLVGTVAREINDMTVGIEFPRGLSSFGKTVLEKQENIKEISDMISMAAGKVMNIKYVNESANKVVKQENEIENLANGNDIPFNIID